MKIRRGYKTELDLNNKQKTLCLKHAEAARVAYNWGLAKKIEAYEMGAKTPSAMTLHKELVLLKKTSFAWMYEVSKSAPQEALRDLDMAYNHYFKAIKRKKQGKLKGKFGSPKFKNKKIAKKSFRLYYRIKVFDNVIQLPRLGKLRLKEHGYLPTNARILSATVSEQTGRWFVSLQVEQEIPDPVNTNTSAVGIDLGIKTLATLSDGITFENQKALKRQLRKLNRLYRSHARKQKNSKNKEKARQKLAKLHAHIANIRKDSVHKLTTYLCKNYMLVAIEDLPIAGMLQNHYLALALIDSGMCAVRQQLTYKSLWYGTQLKVVNRRFPSSKMCSQCGWVNHSLALDDRIFFCLNCKSVIDRDLNAAKNILAASSAERLNACGERSAGSSLMVNETALSEAGTEQQL